MSFRGIPKARGHCVKLTLGNIDTMLRAGLLTRSPERKTFDLWTDKDGVRKDTQRPRFFFTELIRFNMPTPMLARDAGDGALEIVDGCNRIDAIEAFFESKVELPESEIYTDRAGSSRMITFKDLEPAVQHEMMAEIVFPIVVYPADISLAAIQRLVNYSHMVAPTLEGEDLLLMHGNPMMDLLAEVNLDSIRMHERKGPWRVKRQSLLIQWIRIAAMVFDDNLHLSDDLLPCRKWVLDRARAAMPSPLMVDTFRKICAMTLDVYCEWGDKSTASKARREVLKDVTKLTDEEVNHLKSMVGSRLVVPDIAWIFKHYGATAEVRAAVAKMHAGMFRGNIQNERQASLGATRSRRERFGRVFCTQMEGAVEANTKYARQAGTDCHNNNDPLPPKPKPKRKKQQQQQQQQDDGDGEEEDDDDTTPTDTIEISIREAMPVRPSKKPRIDADDAEAQALLALAGDVGPYDAVDLVTGDLPAAADDDPDERPFA